VFAFISASVMSRTLPGFKRLVDWIVSLRAAGARIAALIEAKSSFAILSYHFRWGGWAAVARILFAAKTLRTYRSLQSALFAMFEFFIPH
jgi:hypothetical protein